MAEGSQTVEIVCNKCGTTLGFEKDQKDGDRIICGGCGQDCGSFGEIMEQAGDLAAERLLSPLADIDKLFKG